MTKLALLALLLAACGNTRSEEKKDDTPVQRIEATPAPSPLTGSAAPAGSAGSGSAPAPPPSPAELPAECAQLKETIAKMNACAKFDASAKDQLTKQADALVGSAGSAGVDPASLGTQCKGTSDAILKAGAAACGW